MFKFSKILVLLALCAAVSFAAGPVSVYGALKACTIDGKGRLCGSNGSWANTAVQVRGVSLGWSNTGWESAAFFNAATVNAMVDGWKAEIIRVPLGAHESNGYDTQPDQNWGRVKTAVDAAIAKDVYVIIDWHSHKAHKETEAAKTFFETKVAEYHNNPNVIFEIYNEPRASDGGTWANIKTYAETIIGALRGKGANNLVLVGTPEWSARPNQANGSYLSDSNVGYVFHFYAGSHQTNNGNSAIGNTNPTYSAGITTVLDAGKPIFVTEYGTTTSDGGQGNNYNSHSAANTDAWHTFMDANKISSCAWNVNDKYEGSAFFGTTQNGRFTQNAANFTNTGMMTASGKYIYDKLVVYAPNAPWLNQPSSSSGANPSSSSSAGSVPVMLSQVVFGNSASAYANNISLQVKNEAKLEMFGLNGKSVKTMRFASGAYSVQLSDLPEGLYIAKISFGSEQKILRVPIR